MKDILIKASVVEEVGGEHAVEAAMLYNLLIQKAIATKNNEVELSAAEAADDLRFTTYMLRNARIALVNAGLVEAKLIDGYPMRYTVL